MKLGLIKGFERGFGSAADNLADKLKQERIAAMRSAEQEQSYQREGELISLRSQARMGEQEAQNTFAQERQEDAQSHEKEMARTGLRGGASSRSEYGRTYDDLVRTMPDLNPKDAAEMAFNMASESKRPSRIKFVQDNLESTMFDAYGNPKMVMGKDGEEREITQEEAVAQLTELYKRLSEDKDEPKDDKPKPGVLFTHPQYGDITDSYINVLMKKHNKTREEVMARLGQGIPNTATGQVIRD